MKNATKNVLLRFLITLVFWAIIITFCQYIEASSYSFNTKAILICVTEIALLIILVSLMRKPWWRADDHEDGSS